MGPDITYKAPTLKTQNNPMRSRFESLRWQSAGIGRMAIKKSVTVLIAANAYHQLFLSTHLFFVMFLSHEASIGTHWNIVTKTDAIVQVVMKTR